MAGSMLEMLSRQRKSTSSIKSLTDRELEIFQLIGSGKSSRQIAVQLHISTRTVDAHRAHIKDKLQIPDGTALVRQAVSWVEHLEQE